MMPSFVTTLASFLLTTLASLSFVPSILLVRSRHRHFELFVSCGQALSTLLFSATSSLNIRLMGVASDKYHHVSDVLTETYVCLLCLHLLGMRSEDTMHTLRYAAFSLCWLAKLGDGWSSVFLEVVVLIGFGTPAVAMLAFSAIKTQKKKKLRYVEMSDASASSGFDDGSDDLPPPLLALKKFFSRPLPYSWSAFLSSLLAVSAGVVLLILENIAETEMRLYHAFAQVTFGLASYYLWQLLPCYDKDDFISSYR